MENRRLIECIKKREFLYNQDHPKYMDAKYKAIVWREIGEEMGQPIALCRSRWNNLRDCYRKFHMKSNGVDNPDRKAYKYRDELQFLAAYFHNRDTNPCLADSTGESSKTNNEPPASNNRVKESKQPPPPPPRKRSRSILKEERALEIWENRITACTEAIEQQLQQHALAQQEPSLRLFFESVIMSVSRLKRRNQTIVQQEVLQIISEFRDAEEKAEAT